MLVAPDIALLVDLVTVAPIVAAAATRSRPRAIIADIVAVPAGSAFPAFLVKVADIVAIAAATRSLPRIRTALNVLMPALNGFCPCLAIDPAKFMKFNSRIKTSMPSLELIRSSLP